MRRHFLRNSCGAQRFVGFFVVVDCDFRELIGWAELQSRGTGLLVQVFFKCLPFPACLPTSIRSSALVQLKNTVNL